MFTSKGLKLKIFLKEQGDNETKSQEGEKLKCLFEWTPITGEKAKKFYEDILNESSSTEDVKKPLVIESKAKPQKFKHCQIKSKIFRDSDLLQMAQNNDVKNLGIFFSQNQSYDINVVDDFGWTPLMCAACSGAEEAVKILLQKGANPSKCDRLGNTALQLAKHKDWKSIVIILENFHIANESEAQKEVKFIEPYFCTLCKEQVTLSKKKHESSTLHLFNSKIKTQSFYGIPESNKGFQLLLKEGWDKNKGLGPSGTGRKFPIKAAIKKDRSGFGAEPDKKKNLILQTKHTAKYLSKKKINCNKWREKKFERDFRSEFL